MDTKETNTQIPWNKGKKTGFISKNPELTRAKYKQRIPWNRGLKLSQIPRYSNMGFQRGHKHFEGAEKGWFPQGVIPLTAFKPNDERISGERNPNWAGGVTPIHHRIRTSKEYQEWRSQVFERDNWTCKGCGVRGGSLHADHIKPFALFPELRFELTNGRTLCVPCHKETDSYMNRWITKEQYV